MVFVYLLFDCISLDIRRSGAYMLVFFMIVTRYG